MESEDVIAAFAKGALWGEGQGLETGRSHPQGFVVPQPPGEHKDGAAAIGAGAAGEGPGLLPVPFSPPVQPAMTLLGWRCGGQGKGELFELGFGCVCFGVFMLSLCLFLL